jgi:hypothetical protein
MKKRHEARVQGVIGNGVYDWVRGILLGESRS